MATNRQFSRKLPLWYQACEAIRAEIYERVASEDLRLPTEEELAKNHNVSKITVRQALAVLEEDGLITRTRRRGTEINPAIVRPKELKVLGAFPAVLNQPFVEAPELLTKRCIDTPAELRSKFRNTPTLTHLRRLRNVNGEPVNYCVNYIVPQYGEKITKADVQRWSIPRILRDKYRVQISRIDYVVKAIKAEKEIASFLKVKPQSPLLFFTATAYDANDEVVELGEIYYRAESFAFEMSIDMT